MKTNLIVHVYVKKNYKIMKQNKRPPDNISMLRQKALDDQLLALALLSTSTFVVSFLFFYIIRRIVTIVARVGVVSLVLV